MRAHWKSWLVFALLVGTTAYCVAEQVMVSTTYPSPLGVYQELRATGSVGIGTTDTGGRRLTVGATTADYEFYGVAASGQTNPEFNIAASTGGAFYIQQLSNQPMIFYTNAAEIMRITGTGNVGIGTTTPDKALHVKASGLGPDGGSRAGITVENSSGNKFFLNTWDGVNRFSIGRTGVADDIIINANGNVGIGTTTPLAALDVQGRLHLRDASSQRAYISFPRTAPPSIIPPGLYVMADDDPSTWEASSIMFSVAENKIMMGQPPVPGGTAMLHVIGEAHFFNDTDTIGLPFVGIKNGMVGIGGGVDVFNPYSAGSAPGDLTVARDNKNGVIWFGRDGTSNLQTDLAGNFVFQVDGVNRAWIFPDRTYFTGNVGIGTSTPDPYRLDVNGDARISGSLTLGPGGIIPADIAENMDCPDCEAGDVVVVDPEHDHQLTRSTQAYDPTFAGVISTKPALNIGGNRGESAKPLALAGQVPCKVTAENGPIKRGDLLVTSSTPGYAMRADSESIKPGTLIGKALEPLAEGEGTILVLIIGG